MLFGPEPSPASGEVSRRKRKKWLSKALGCFGQPKALWTKNYQFFADILEKFLNHRAVRIRREVKTEIICKTRIKGKWDGEIEMFISA